MRTFKIPVVREWGVSFKKDRVSLFTMSLWLMFLFAGLLYFLVSFRNLPPTVPLFFSRPWGDSQLAPKIYLLILPVGSFLLGIVNIGFAVSLHRSNQFLSRVLLGITPILSFLSALAVINIINLIK